MIPRPPSSTLFPYTTLFRSIVRTMDPAQHVGRVYAFRIIEYKEGGRNLIVSRRALLEEEQRASAVEVRRSIAVRSEEHTSELQSRLHLVCRLLLEKKKGDLW